MVHLYYVWGETINPGRFRWSAHRQQHGSLISVPVNKRFSAHAHYNEFVFVPALAFNRMNLAIMQSGPK
jgi:hypothetical protein